MTTRNAASMPVLPSEWEARGYHGKGNVEPLIGSIAGRTAIVCGGAAGVFQEYEQARQMISEPIVFGVNDVGMYLPDMDHWVSLHADNLFTWALVRAMAVKANHPYKVHSVDARHGVEYVWDRLSPLMYLSGYFAMQLAWIMGAERIILCGCPGSRAPRFFEAQPRQLSTDDNEKFGYGSGTDGTDDSIHAQIQHEMKRQPEFRAAVRSMSGATRDYFGGLE